MNEIRMIHRMYAEQMLQTQYLGEILKSLHEMLGKISEHDIPTKLLNDAEVALGINEIRDSLAKHVVKHYSDKPRAAKKS